MSAEDVAAVAGIEAVPSILEVACRVTGMRFAAVARVTESEWIACAVRDELGFGLEPGGKLELATTICNEIRQCGEAVVIDHVDEDPDFRGHPTPALYGFQSYLSMPIVRKNGEFFGTLCALDPLPARLKDGAAVQTFALFAELIALHLDSQQRLARSEADLSDAAEAAELREQFIAVLGHDLRNPVAAIEAGTRMLAAERLGERATKVLGLMQESCRRMAELIDDVLDFARGRLGGGLPLERVAATDLGSVIGQVAAELRPVHPGRDILIEAGPWRAVSCDPPRIAQLVSNLIANALTHGDPASPVRVTAGCADGMFKLSVANKGPAIPAEKRARLFQPFTRGADSGGEGLGLGLYIASEIARAHGGTLEVGSDEAETRFTLAMPAGADAEAVPAAVAVPA